MNVPSSHSRNKFPLMAEINMVPLIDICLVLLIVFMIITPFIVSSQIKINLPKAVTTMSADDHPIRIKITEKKTFYVNDQSVSADRLATALKAEIAGRSDAVVLIEADHNVPFEFVVRAMDQAKIQGAQKLGVAVLKEQ